jgi:hypothetical protein
VNQGPFDYSSYSNPVPGGYNRYAHGGGSGGPFVWNLLRWTEGFAKGDVNLTTTHAGEILNLAISAGASQATINDLREKLQEAIVQNHKGAQALKVLESQQNGGNNHTGNVGAGSADGIDWYEPDPNRFYVLDKRSGAELNDVLTDLRILERYVKRGARPPNRLLCIGDPGNGKTTGALWLGSQLGVKVALVRIDGVIGGIAGQTAKNLRACFEAAAAEKAILVIDEFEAVAVSRTDNGPNVPQWTKEVTSALLQLLDSLPPTQIVIGATNVPGVVDKAVLRRLRKHVYFYPPDREARTAMLRGWWGSGSRIIAPYNENAFQRLLDLSEGLSGDFLERTAEEANRAAARRAETAPITVTDVEAAVMSAIAVHQAASGRAVIDTTGELVATSDAPPDAPLTVPFAPVAE